MPSLQIALFGLLPGCLATKPEYPGQPRRISEARVAAIPTPVLRSDFKKNNVTASWAPGYPKVWAQADKKFSIPWETVPRIGSAFSPDGKFLLLTNGTDTDVIKVDTSATVSSFKNTYNQARGGLQTTISVASGGEFDFFLSAVNWTENGQLSRTTQQRISADGVPVGPVVDRAGAIDTGYSPALDVNSDGKRVMVAFADNFDILIYNLEDPSTRPVELKGHFDSVLSAVLSPDKKTLASTGFDGYVKLWDIATGKVILDVPPADPSNAPYNQNWVTRFSPDGKKLLYTIGAPQPEVKVVSLDTPDFISVGTYDSWIRSVEYSSDGSYVALGAFDWIRVLRTSDYALVQEWRVDYGDIRMVTEVLNLHWYDNDTKLRWSYGAGSEMYDFETNLKYRWGPDENDQTSPPGWWTSTTDWHPFPNLGWFGNYDSDLNVRIWPLPA